MAKINIILTAALLLGIVKAGAQDGGLPEFTVENLGKNRTLVSWENHYGDMLLQVNVQVSYDSLRNFGTVFEPLSPSLPQNGFVNTKAYEGKIYYRLFFVLNGGAYYFTQSKAVEDEDDLEGKTRFAVKEKTITVRTPLSILAHLKPAEFIKFRDSISSTTKDTLVLVNQNEMVLKYYGHSDVNFVGFVGLNPEGFVEIKLPDAKLKKYKVVFKDNSGAHLFTINHVADTDLVLDKTNFMQAGWYSFELFQDDKIIERNRFYLQSDF